VRDAELEAAMDAVRRLAALARSAREAAGLRVRQPLAAMRVAAPASVRGPTFEAFLELLAREVNVKEVSVVESDAALVRLRARPNFRSLGKVYGKRTPMAAAAAAELTQEQLRRLEDGDTVTLAASSGEQFDYRPEDVVVEREVKTDWLVASEGPVVAALDPRLTPALRQEGLAREVVNRVQRLRKEAGYDYNTRIDLSLSGGHDVVAAAESFQAFIARETLARRLEAGTDLADPDVKEVADIEGHRVLISLRRHDGVG
jgi:isoleucyl-tRNA synthetase